MFELKDVLLVIMASNGESSQRSANNSIDNSSAKPNNSSNSTSNHQGNQSNHTGNHSSNYSKRNQSSRPVRKKNYNYFNERPVFTCLVCCQDLPSFKLKAIFAIGPCNHMVCYYCSTKMRVLCEQNECPTCRQELSEVSR